MKVEYDSSDPEQVAERGKESKEREVLRVAGLRDILSTQQGRVWMFEHLSECGVYRISYVEGSDGMTAFNEGKRSIGLKIMYDLMQCCKEQYFKMLKENEK